MTVTHKIPARGSQFVYLCLRGRKIEAAKGNYGAWLWREVTCAECLKRRVR